MDHTVAALMSRPQLVADAFDFVGSRWSTWVRLARKRQHLQSMSNDWMELRAMLNDDDSLAAHVLAVSAVASLLDDDGTLPEGNRPEAESRLQIACEIDALPNFPAYFYVTADFWKLKHPDV